MLLYENKDDLEKCEYLIPDVLFESIKDNYATCQVLPTTATWYGVTYKEDTPSVQKALEDMVTNKEYPNDLWEKVYVKNR